MLSVWVLVPGLVAVLVTYLATPQVIRLARHLRALDIPGGRKQQPDAVPRLGGIGIIAGLMAALVASGLLKVPMSVSAAELGWLLLATAIVFLLGIVDDIRGLGALSKFSIQSIAALIVIYAGWQFSVLRLPFEGSFYLGFLAPVLTLVWIVGVTNAINLIDGLDGLAGGIVVIVAGSLLALASFHGSTETVLLTSAMCGACLGFLRHNWRPAKVYMGDCGSLTLGFLLATVSLHSTPSVKASAAVAILVPVLALGLPVFDTLLVMWYRFLRGHRLANRIARMFRADRAHLHHLLVDNAKERRVVILTLYGLAAGFCVMALLVATSSNWLLGLFFLAVEMVAVVLIRQAGLTAATRRLAEDRRSQVSHDEADILHERARDAASRPGLRRAAEPGPATR